MYTLFIGNNTIRLPIVESTNTYAQELVKHSKPPEGTIVLAQEQLHGRGQRGNTWLSEARKNLTFSLILYPTSIPAENQFLLTQLISIALVDFIKHEMNSESIKIKWPNDIYVGNKKIGGVLIENSLRGPEISSAVIGIGLNINQEIFGDLNATSLKIESGKSFDLLNCYEMLCASIEARYLQFINKNFDSLKADYLKKLFQLDELAYYEIEGKSVQAKIIGVNKAGKLLLEKTNDCMVLELGLKEVKFIF